jgi:hypothetical protein
MQRDIMELRGLLNSKIVFKNLEGERLIWKPNNKEKMKLWKNI